MSIDTLAYSKALQDAGVSAPQAEAHAVALNRAVQGGLATKTDLGEMENRLLRYMVVQAFAILALNAAVTAAIISAMR